MYYKLYDSIGVVELMHYEGVGLFYVVSDGVLVMI